MSIDDAGVLPDRFYDEQNRVEIISTTDVSARKNPCRYHRRLVVIIDIRHSQFRSSSFRLMNFVKLSPKQIRASHRIAARTRERTCVDRWLNIFILRVSWNAFVQDLDQIEQRSGPAFVSSALTLTGGLGRLEAMIDIA